jgi:putative transposase
MASAHPYIRLQMEFVYLAVLLDAFSRRCIGWALQRTLEAALALKALRMALRQRRPKPGLVHHSVYRTEYRNLEEAQASIKEFLRRIYNQERLHSALGYRPPLEFERDVRRAQAAGKGHA